MPINIKITGHSRGGIAASETVFKIMDWLEKNTGKDFMNMVNVDIIQRDPVPIPGVITILKTTSITEVVE